MCYYYVTSCRISYKKVFFTYFQNFDDWNSMLIELKQNKRKSNSESQLLINYFFRIDKFIAFSHVIKHDLEFL
jgi:hypothetical protein